MVRETQNKEGQQKKSQTTKKSISKQITVDSGMEGIRQQEFADHQSVQVRHVTHRLCHMSLAGVKLSNREINLWKRASRTKSMALPMTRADLKVHSNMCDLTAAVLDLEERGVLRGTDVELIQSDSSDPVVGNEDESSGDGKEKTTQKIKRLQRVIRVLRNEKMQALNLLNRARKENESVCNKLEQVLRALKEKDQALAKADMKLRLNENARKQVEASFEK